MDIGARQTAGTVRALARLQEQGANLGRTLRPQEDLIDTMR